LDKDENPVLPNFSIRYLQNLGTLIKKIDSIVGGIQSGHELISLVLPAFVKNFTLKVEKIKLLIFIK